MDGFACCFHHPVLPHRGNASPDFSCKNHRYQVAWKTNARFAAGKSFRDPARSRPVSQRLLITLASPENRIRVSWGLLPKLMDEQQ